jgi:hypothetical protein
MKLCTFANPQRAAALDIHSLLLVGLDGFGPTKLNRGLDMDWTTSNWTH